MKLIRPASLLLELGLTTVLNAQNVLDTVSSTHFMQHTLFVCRDASYELTRVLDEDFQGLDFQRGYLQADDFPYQGIALTAIDLKDQSSTTHIARAELVPGLDTLTSLFPSCQYSPPAPFYEGELEYIEDLLTEDAFLSFALRVFGVVQLDPEAAYYFGPVNGSVRDIGKPYVLCTIEHWRDPMPRFHYVLGRLAPEGFKVVEVNDLEVPHKAKERIRQQIDTFVNADWDSCVMPGEAGTSRLLAAGGKKVSRTNYCQGKRFRHNSVPALTAIAMAFRQYSNR